MEEKIIEAINDNTLFDLISCHGHEMRREILQKLALELCYAAEKTIEFVDSYELTQYKERYKETLIENLSERWFPED